MDKLAYNTGVALAFRDAGYSPDMVKEAFVQSGMDASEAAMIVKEAFWGRIAGGLGRAAQGVFKMTKAMQQPLAAGGESRKLIGRMGTSIGKGFQHLAKNPLGATLGFGKNMIGGITGGGQGVGGALGKGLLGYTVASNLVGGE